MMIQMAQRDIIICILLAIITTNIIRILPMTLIKGSIRNRFLRSVLYYVPYVTLAVMTFPAIIETTPTPWIGLAALIIGIICAWFGAGLFPVAVICCTVVYILG